MQNHNSLRGIIASLSACGLLVLVGCGSQLGLTSAGASSVETSEPEQYQATVTLKREAIIPPGKTGPENPIDTSSARVARSGRDRRMEVEIPTLGRVVFLDKGGKNYVFLPKKKQYVELNPNSATFLIRAMFRPEGIIWQVQKIPGMERLGRDRYDGRDVISYRYGALPTRPMRAEQEGTESLLFVDRETLLPLRSEAISRGPEGESVRGYMDYQFITEITEIKTEAPASLFDDPPGYDKVEEGQVREQLIGIFLWFGRFGKPNFLYDAPAGPPKR